LSRNQNPPQQAAIAARLKAIENRLKKVENGSVLQNATVTNNGIVQAVAVDTSGNNYTVMYIGDLDNIGRLATGDYGFVLLRQTGAGVAGNTVALAVWAEGGPGTYTAPVAQVIQMFDQSGNIIFSEDGLSGTGLANPWIPLTWNSASGDVVTTQTTASSTEAFNFYFPKQHPKMQVDVWIINSDSGSGSVRLYDNNASAWLGTAQTIPGSSNAYYTLTVPVSGGIMSYQNIGLHAWYSSAPSGSNNISVRMRSAYGRQT
jgi:hypothetical protein